jgi:group I intron endonuclease
MSAAQTGNTNRLGSTHSAETPEGAAISDALTGEKNPIFGKTHSAEAKAAISEANKGNTNRALSVYVYDQNNILVNEFPSQCAAAAFLGVTLKAVSKLVDTGRRNRKAFIIRLLYLLS